MCHFSTFSGEGGRRSAIVPTDFVFWRAMSLFVVLFCFILFHLGGGGVGIKENNLTFQFTYVDKCEEYYDSIKYELFQKGELSSCSSQTQ